MVECRVGQFNQRPTERHAQEVSFLRFFLAFGLDPGWEQAEKIESLRTPPTLDVYMEGA